MKVLSTILLAFVWMGESHAQAREKDAFTLVKQERNVSVYERWTKYPQSNPPVKSREMKTEFYYNGNIANALRVIKDEGRGPDWQSHVTEFKIYPQRDTTMWFEYTYHDIPWPVSDQDHFMEYKVAMKHPAQMIITFKSKVNNTLAPERKGANRMELAGTWTLDQVTPKKVKVTYRVFSKPIDIPRIFTDPIIRGSMVDTMEQFINIVEGKKGT